MRLQIKIIFELFGNHFLRHGNPADSSFAASAFSVNMITNYLNEVFPLVPTSFWSQHHVRQCCKEYLSHDGQHSSHVRHWRVNRPTLWDCCVSMTGRVDFEGCRKHRHERLDATSKLLQSCCILCTLTENENDDSFSLLVRVRLRGVSCVII